MKKILVYCLIISAVIIAGIEMKVVLNKRRPNILLITMDALRPDYMGCYGYKRNTTPNIDKFAKGAVIFTQAISHSSHTAVSNSSLITATYPIVHKVEDFGYTINPKLPTLAGVLSSHGYTTVFISDQIGLSWVGGFDRYFDVLRFSLPYRRLPSGKIVKLVDITTNAIEWLRENRRKKFFLWVYYLDPHAPYTPVFPYNKMFVDENINKHVRTLPFCEKQYSWGGLGCIPYYVREDDIRDIPYYISQYCGEIRSDDARIGKLLKEIKRLKLDRNTIVIINSDHGEGMGEHNQYFCHTIYLYDYLIHIPLIIKVPGLKVANKRIGRQVRMIDIAPTILDFAGIKEPSSMQGVSLKPLILGEKVNFPKFSFGKWKEKSYVRTEGWKLIYNASSGAYELYNLKKDPQEVDNLVNRERKMFNFLRRMLLRHISSASSDKKKRTNLTEEDKKLLRSLGYTQ